MFHQILEDLGISLCVKRKQLTICSVSGGWYVLINNFFLWNVVYYLQAGTKNLKQNRPNHE